MKWIPITMVALLGLSPALPAAAVDTPPGDDPRSLVFIDRERALPDEGVDMDAWREATPIGSSYRQFDLGRRLAIGLQGDPEGGDVETVTPGEEESAADSIEKKNPGRALLLSAIMPGAGELYAGKTWRAAGFFALEIASWVGAVYYAQAGDDKEKEYENFAEKHYKPSYYRSVEYAAADDPNHGNLGRYEEGPDAWETLPWQDKIQYLPENFTHELPTEHNQQYYENIGKYLTQFGYGWDDYINGRTDQQIVSDAQAMGYKWGSNGQASSARVLRYIDMRDESNQLLDRSATFFAVIMVNHVVSALHAGFTVRAMNKAAEVEPQAGRILHNDELVQTVGFRIRF
ncbi:MAG: hypothetical protein MAG453_02083 [Calditrichaeota bacterium]|nr:hypothetical protein [Calditrichota bacterium]